MCKINFKLNEDNYSFHNFHNEKLNEWLVENYVPGTSSAYYGCDHISPVCDCGNENEDYFFYYDKYGDEDLSQVIKGLKIVEREEIKELLKV